MYLKSGDIEDGEVNSGFFSIMLDDLEVLVKVLLAAFFNSPIFAPAIENVFALIK